MANDKLNDALEWSKTALQQTKLNTETVVQTPWSSVVRIKTGNELFYLKTTPALIALEANIIKILRRCLPLLRIMLSYIALIGTSLRSILKKKFDTDLLCGN